MSPYRIYLLNAHRRIADFREIDCADDKTALRHAGNAVSGYIGAEVWSRNRLVGTTRFNQSDVTGSGLEVEFEG